MAIAERAGGPRHIELDELQAGAVEKLDPASAAFINASGLARVSPLGLGLYRLEPVGTVGSVRTGSVQVDVRPRGRLGLQKLLFLLSYSAEPGFSPHAVAAKESPDLWAALASSLALLGEQALGRGVLQGYREVDESLRTVKGRIRISDQMSRHPGLMVPLEVSYDEFSSDIAENRILRAAVERMMQVPGLLPEARSRLRHLKTKLDGVTYLTAGAPLPAWQPTRLNQRYHPALRLAALILRHASAESGAGPQRASAFVVNMNHVFQDFVGTALRAAMAKHPGETRLRHGALLNEAVDDADRITVRPDVVHFLGGRPVMVYDARYTARTDAGASLSADHFQVLAHCTALGVPSAWLIYAGKGEVTLRQILNTEIDIIEFPLDLSLPPARILAAVDDLADQSWGEVVRQARLSTLASPD